MKNWFALIALLFATSVNGSELPTLDYIKKIKHIEVLLFDVAEDACWTNLTESREYAEEKIRMIGGKVYESGPKICGEHYFVMVAVRSHRSQDGNCFGFVEVHLQTCTKINGETHYADARQVYNYFTNPSNANKLVIETIQAFFTSRE